MTTASTVHVRCLAFLHAYQRERDLPVSFDVEVPDSGISAKSLAKQIELPTERIEGVFLNNRISGLDATVRRGDRVAFVPAGTPASHPSFFGPFVTR